jgi:tetratricopeptide (TPR) repeat protein
VETWGFKSARALGLPTRAETSAKGRFNLGVTYAALAGDDAADPWFERAATELRRSVESEEAPETYVELGKVLARSGRNVEAIEVYREAARLRPEDYRIQHAIGLLSRRAGDAQSAEAAFVQSLTLAPGYAPSAVQLGELLLDLGRRDEAAGAFRHALGIRPNDARARAGLEAALSP